jgi:ABC-type branched-subunit amino acid transport system substrate-binding protein
MQVLKRIRIFFLTLVLVGCAQTYTRQSDRIVIQNVYRPSSGEYSDMYSDSSQNLPSPYTVEDASTERFNVAMLLPLSGQMSSYGQGMKNAAMMALEDTDNARLTLRFYDTKSSAGGAEAAAEEALSSGASLILGPLMSEEVSAVSTLAQNADVPVISFSTSPSVLTHGVYTLGLLGQEQIERIIGYAVAQNRHRIAVLAPDSTAGMNTAKAAVQAAARHGVEVTKIGFYPAETLDFTTIVQAMTKQDSDGSFGFDALLIPESGNRLKSAAAMFGYVDVAYPDVLFLGTSVWENTSLTKETTLYHAVYPVLSRVHGDYFNKKYENLFGEAPNSLYTFAYDGVALASSLSRKNLQNMAQNITDSDGFVGLNGVFRILSDGTNQHSLDVVEITEKQLKTVDAAPKTLGAGAKTAFVPYISFRPRIYGKDAQSVYLQLFGAMY